MLTITEHSDLLLAHELTPAGPIPTAQQSDSCYPYESYCETANRPCLRYFRFLTLENDFLRVSVCPDLGGKVYSMHHKKSGKNVLFTEPVVRPVRILPRQFYIGGGIEVSFPISHTPVQCEKLSYCVSETPERAFVWCGEREMKFGMHFTVEYSLGKDDPFLTQRTFFDNPTEHAHPWMSWSNAGVPAFADTQLHYPNGKVLEHGEKLHMIDWQTQGPRTQGEIDTMTGWFWREPHCNAFGAFTPSCGCGLYHVALPEQMPGIKLWSDGVGAHTAFVNQWTLSRAQCLEIQAGPLVDQGVKHELQPGQSHTHTEFWIPTDEPLDIYALRVPDVALPPEGEIPRFDFARQEEVGLWLAVTHAYACDDVVLLPMPPALDCNRWPPAGVPGLEQALRWAADSAQEAGPWRYCLGTLLAALEKNDEAIKELLASGDDRGCALAARLLRRVRGDCAAAVAAYAQIKSPVVARHPQIVFERDIALAGMGTKTLATRRYWLDETAALCDDWLIERRAARLVDEGQFAQAKVLLEHASFQLVHQRYVRLPLWRKIETALNLPPKMDLNAMGEDTLAQFGQYQEYVGE